MDKYSYLKRKTELLQEFLDTTEKISECLTKEEQGDEQLGALQAEVGKRESIIQNIEKLNAEPREDSISLGLKDEYEKLKWLEQKLMEKLVPLEKENGEKLDQAKSQYMSKVKNTKESIRVVDAYSQQMPEEAGVGHNFNRAK